MKKWINHLLEESRKRDNFIYGRFGRFKGLLICIILFIFSNRLTNFLLFELLRMPQDNSFISLFRFIFSIVLGMTFWYKYLYNIIKDKKSYS